MENKVDEPHKHKNGVTHRNGASSVLHKQIDNTLILQENVTSIDLSSRNIEVLDGNVKLPVNLRQLNLSHNKLVDVPSIVLNLENLKVLDLSYNLIQYFDDTPNFCHTLELLDISNNHLNGPPYWVWTEKPQNLTRLKLSNNPKLTESFKNGYMEQLLSYTTLVLEVELQNCSLSKYPELLSTFPKVKSLSLGTEEYKLGANSFTEIPCRGLDNCSDLQRLNMCNTRIYTLNASIEVFKNLAELNLAQNNFNGLPTEFCNLENLVTCVLSYNKLLYLPEEMCKMQNLVRLYLDGNELCMVPAKICELPNLKTLDLYDNHLNEVPENWDSLEELDVAQNYFDEPENIEYVEKKEKLRLVHETRNDGRKKIINKSDCEENSGSDIEDDEELYELFQYGKRREDPSTSKPDQPSSPEDWESDDYWVPFCQNNIPLPQSPWLFFVKKKMDEGNFCPMDAHPVSIAEQVRFDKLCNPQVNHESDGQFDDYSSDDS